MLAGTSQFTHALREIIVSAGATAKSRWTYYHPSENFIHAPNRPILMLIAPFAPVVISFHRERLRCRGSAALINNIGADCEYCLRRFARQDWGDNVVRRRLPEHLPVLGYVSKHIAGWIFHLPLWGGDGAHATCTPRFLAER